MIKKGDTLVEVALAVGIFSMVAIAIVAVMSSGTSNTQTALETTLAREEIDTQAETLRFIQASAAAEGYNGDQGSFSALWQIITGGALQPTNDESATATLNKIYHFSPESCGSLYDLSNSESNIYAQHAFFIDLEKLQDPEMRKDAFVSASDSKFRPTSTYPRVYNGDGNAVAEGIFVVAVKDASNTKILSPNLSKTDGADGPSYFYDFYIRTCWDSSGSDGPSTISTVIRLLGK